LPNLITIIDFVCLTGAKRTGFGDFPPAAFDQLMKQRVSSWGAANARAAMQAFDCG
jgi:hypothetical protein